MAGTVSSVDDNTFTEEIGGATTPVLVDFWAEWCGPCKLIAPILEEIASEHSETLTIRKLNVDEAPQTAQQFGVMSIPTLILFKDGAETKRIVGAKPKGAILNDITPFL